MVSWRSPGPQHRYQHRRRRLLVAVLVALSACARSLWCHRSLGPTAWSSWRSKLGVDRHVLVWHKERWHDGRVKVAVKDRIRVGLTGDDHVGDYERKSLDIQPAMEDRGMSLSQLQRFWEICKEHCNAGGVMNHDGTEYPLECAPTWLIVQNVVKNLTNNGSRPLVDAMDESWPEEGRPSTVDYFVSHAWQCPFYNILEQLEILGDGYFWIDCFACTQNGPQKGSRLELKSDPEVFARALTAPSTSAQILCLDTQAPVLERLWIIFEISRAHAARKPLRIPTPQGIASGGGAIDWGRTFCTMEDDRNYIMKEVEHIGRERVSEYVRESMLGAYQDRVDAMCLEHGSDSAEHAHALLDMGRVLRDAGKSSLAVERLQAALKIFRHHDFGNDHLKFVAEARNCFDAALRDLQRELEGALATRSSQSGGSDLQVAVTRGDLGDVLMELGKLPEAQHEHEAALNVSRQHLGDDHPDVARARCRLANVLRGLGRLREAQQELEVALKILRRHFGDDHLDAANANNSLALVLWGLPQPPEALKFLDTTLKLDHPEVAGARRRLRKLFFDLREPPEVLKMLEAALEVFKEHLGDDHRDVARTRASLGSVLIDQGDLPRARQELEAALRTFRRHFTSSHTEVARARSSLGIVLGRAGDLRNASQELEAALGAFGQHFREDGPEVAMARRHLGDALRDLGRPQEALHEHEAALKVCRERFTDDHPEVAVARSRLGATLRDLGWPREARCDLEAALTIFRPGNFGNDHPEVAVARSHLGITLRDLGRPEESRQELEAALKVFRRHFGNDHPQTAAARSRLGVALRDLGRPEESRQELEAALKVFRQHFGDEHPQTAVVRIQLDVSLLSPPEKLQAPLDVLRGHFGDDHPEVAVARSCFGHLLERSGKEEEARRELEAALEVLRRHFGGDHPEVAVARSRLVIALRDLGRPEEARRELQAASEAFRRLGLGDAHPDFKLAQNNVEALRNQVRSRLPVTYTVSVKDVDFSTYARGESWVSPPFPLAGMRGFILRFYPRGEMSGWAFPTLFLESVSPKEILGLKLTARLSVDGTSDVSRRVDKWHGHGFVFLPDCQLFSYTTFKVELRGVADA